MTNPEFNQAQAHKFMIATLDELPPLVRQQWLDARLDFVQSAGWLNGFESDQDEYDKNPATKQILLFEADRLVYGMRLTPVENIASSLSFKMLAANPDMQRHVVESLNLLPVGGGIWDLTRLIPVGLVEERKDISLSFTRIARLFGEGLRRTRTTDSPSPAWLFLMENSLANWLSRTGVQLNEITIGKVSPGDRENSIFGFALPAEIAANTPDSGFTKIAMRGEV